MHVHPEPRNHTGVSFSSSRSLWLKQEVKASISEDNKSLPSAGVDQSDTDELGFFFTTTWGGAAWNWCKVRRWIVSTSVTGIRNRSRASVLTEHIVSSNIHTHWWWMCSTGNKKQNSFLNTVSAPREIFTVWMYTMCVCVCVCTHMHADGFLPLCLLNVACNEMLTGSHNSSSSRTHFIPPFPLMSPLSGLISLSLSITPHSSLHTPPVPLHEGFQSGSWECVGVFQTASLQHLWNSNSWTHLNHQQLFE